MNIKDFSPGQTVYLLKDDGRGKTYTQTATVAKIGRKYLSIKSGWTIHFESMDYFPDGLVESGDFGTRVLLFSSEQSLNDYLEKEQLEKWLIDAARKPYTLEQLREVKKILDG